MISECHFPLSSAWGSRHSLMRALIAGIKGMDAGLTFYYERREVEARHHTVF